MLNVLGSDDEGNDVVEMKSLYKVDHRLVATACGNAKRATLVVQLSQGVGNVRKHRHANLGIDILEDAAVGGCAQCRLLLVHRFEYVESLKQRQADGGGYLVVGVLRQVHGVERAVKRVEYNGTCVGNGAVEVENY